MTQDEIICMAREAGFQVSDTFGVQAGAYPIGEKIERFAALVAAHEREKQAEQEPVAWMQDRNDLYVADQRDKYYTVPVYAAPVRTKDLTDDEIRFWIGRFPFLLNEESEKWVIGLARVIIAADREKNK